MPKKKQPKPEDQQQRNKLAREAILRAQGGLRGVKAEMPCPNCGKTLTYTCVAYSTVIRADCATPGCTHFEE